MSLPRFPIGSFANREPGTFTVVMAGVIPPRSAGLLPLLLIRQSVQFLQMLDGRESNSHSSTGPLHLFIN